jgi:hypothetical protein
MLTRAFLILEGRAGTTERNTSLNVNRVSVLLWLIVGAVHDFDFATFEEAELERFPRSAFLDRRISIQ